MLLFGGYYSLKYYIYSKINEQLPVKIKFSNLGLSIYPIGININDIKKIPIKNKNIVSFRSVSLQIPLLSLFSRTKEIDLVIHKPVILLNENLSIKTPNQNKRPTFRISTIKINNGKLIFHSKKLRFQMAKFDLDSARISDHTLYKLSSPYLRIQFPMSKKKKWVTVEGDLVSNIKQYRDYFKINNFVWNTRDLKINANGKLYKDSTFVINSFLQGNPEHILKPALERLTIKGLVYGNARITRAKDKKISVKGKFNASTISSGGEIFSNLKGTVNWDNLRKHLRINAFFSDDQLRASLNIDLENAMVKIRGSNVSGHKLANMIDIYDDVPIGGRMTECDITVYKRIEWNPLD